MLSDKLFANDFAKILVNAYMFEHDIAKMKKLLILTNELPTEEVLKIDLKLFCYLLAQKQPLQKKEMLLPIIEIVTQAHEHLEVEHVFIIYFQLCDLFMEDGQISLAVLSSEDSKLAVLQCMYSLFSRIIKTSYKAVYTEKTAAPLSVGITVATKIFSEEKYLHLRVKALEFLLLISQNDEENLDIIEAVSSVFIKYIPGLVVPLMNVVQKDIRAQSQVRALAVQLLGHLLYLALRDLKTEENSGVAAMTLWTGQISLAEKNEILSNPCRTSKWISCVVSSLQNFINDLARSIRTDDGLVRDTVIKVLTKLYKNCLQSLGRAAASIVQALLYATEYQSGNLNKRIINDYFQIKSMSAEKVQLLRNIFSDLPMVYIKNLKEAVNLQKDDDINYYLVSLSSYLAFNYQRFNDHLNPLIIPDLCKVLISSSDLEISDIQIGHDFEYNDADRLRAKWYLVNKKRHRILKRIFYLLGEQSMDVLADFCVEDNDHFDVRWKKLFALNLAIRGCDFAKKDKDGNIQKSIIDCYRSINENFDNISPENLPDKEYKCRIAEVAISIKGFGRLALSLKKEYEKYLSTDLYYVVARMGHYYSALKEAGVTAINQIASALGHTNIVDFYNYSARYLAFNLILRVRKMEDISDAALIVALKCPSQSLPFFRQAVQQILTSSNFKYKSCQVKQFLLIFHAFVMCVYQETNRKPDEKTTPKSDKNELTINEQLISTIMRRCLHYLPMCDKTEIVLCLDLLSHGLIALSTNEDELLPLVHQIWSPLVKQFNKNSSPHQIHQSFKLLIIMAQLSKDFIRTRTLKEVLPVLCEVLRSSINTFKCNNNNKKIVSYMQHYKLLVTLLGGLGSLVCNLHLQERETYTVTLAVAPYLKNDQEKELQEGASKSIRELMEYDPSAITVIMNELRKDGGYSDDTFDSLFESNMKPFDSIS